MPPEKKSDVLPVALRFGAVFPFGGEQLEDQDRDANDDEGVGHVEVGPGITTPQAEMQEVDDFAAHHTVVSVGSSIAPSRRDRSRRRPHRSRRDVKRSSRIWRAMNPRTS